jgi:hypothetical protein
MCHPYSSPSLAGRKIVVKEDFDVDRDKYGRIITDKDRERMSSADQRARSVSPRRGGGGGRSRGGGGMSSSGGGGGMVGFGNTYGLSTRFLESLGIDCELHTRVFVANLDYDVSGPFLSPNLDYDISGPSLSPILTMM